MSTSESQDDNLLDYACNRKLSHTTGSETDDHVAVPILPTTRPQSRDGSDPANALPTLTHRLRHTSSILSVVIGRGNIYAGTEEGEIVIYGLDTFQQIALIEAHRSSVLSLCLSKDQELLFSGGGDRVVNVWKLSDLSRVCAVYPSSDVGDIFCFAYSQELETLYLGAQNTTVQWCCIRPPKTTSNGPATPHPSMRDDPFFDSLGPGGVRTPRPLIEDVIAKHARGGHSIEIEKQKVKHFAHNGYVYCMVLTPNVLSEFPEKELLVTAGSDGTVRFWAMQEDDGAITWLFDLDDGREEGHAILSLALEGTFLYTGRTGGEIDVWDLETRQLVRNVRAHRDDVLTICTGGGFLFSAAVTGYVRKFDRQYQLKSRLKAHEGRVLTSAFATFIDRPIYITGGSDKSLAVWEIDECAGASSRATKTSDEMLVEYLRRFVSYRTVSSDPKYQVDCRRGASFLRSVFKNFGATTEMLLTPDSCNPVIMAKFRGNPATANKRKKILFYGHYDVVAADNAHGKWLADPFNMQGIDGSLYGRGTSDNKGPIMAAIFACSELMDEKTLTSDVVFLIEGEEERGSMGFEETVRANKELIGDVDWILLANSYWLDDRIPCLTYGLRGVIHATVQVDSAHPDLHSGVDGSAQLDEPLKDLVMLLNTLMGKNGKVEIPSFYDPIPDLTREEAELYADITHALLQHNPELGEPRALADSLMHRWRDPSLTIHRFQTSGPSNATIIPRCAKSTLSLRLVPNQEAKEVAKDLTDYLQAEFGKLDSKNTLKVTIDHQAEPWVGDWKNDLFQTLEEAIMEAWGPIDQSRRRRRSSALPRIGVHARSRSSQIKADYFNVKTQQTTSAVLASEGSPTRPPVASPSNENSPSKNKQNGVAYRPSSSDSSAIDVSTNAQTRRKPLYIREGGSIPAIRFLEKEFNAPAAHFPCGQASDSAHLDNERLRLVNLYKSREIFKKVFRDLPAK